MGAVNQIIEHYSRRISDPVSRLRFQRACLTEEQAVHQGTDRRSRLRERIRTLEILVQTPPFQPQWLRKQDHALLWLVYKSEVVWAGLFAGRVLKVGGAAALAVVLLGVAGVGVSRQFSHQGSSAVQETADDSKDMGSPDVWLVETAGGTKLYSNGLTISDEFLTHTGPRSYPVFASDEPRWETARRSSEPAGIVYHTTASDLASFEAANNRLILRYGHQLLQFIGREQLYHFVIDRFGRVYRIVPEREFAYHAGNSIWSDEKGLYLGLNQSFIGIAFETSREVGSGKAAADLRVTPAQLRGARLLTAWLRREFQIPARNCVAHEMVSVNPDKMLIGHHTDWAGRFPFDEVGLPDNYRETVPSVARWGFRYDEAFVAKIGGRVWPGVADAVEVFQRQVALHGNNARAYRKQLEKQYQALLDRLRTEQPTKTWADASL